MTFVWPWLLWLLLIVPVLIGVYVLLQRRRQRFALRYASLSLVKEALGNGPGLRRHIPPALFLLSLVVMLLAFARPQTVVTLPSNEGTIILTLDVSGSMQADDLKPDRMEAAKSAAITFVDKEPPSVRIGVVSFTDNAAIVQAPTNDHEAVKNAIARLRPQRGTAIGRGILTSIDAITEGTDASPVSPSYSPFGAPPNSRRAPTPTPVPKGKYASAIVVLLTDGENNQYPSPLDVVDEAVNRGIRIYTVGVGSAAGTTLHIQGRSILTRLDESTLKKIASLTDGEYFNASSANDLQAIYSHLSTTIVLRTEKSEVTVLFTALAAGISLVSGALSLLWFNRLP